MTQAETWDDVAFDAFFRAEFESLASFATILCGRADIGEELAQDAMVRLIVRLRRGRSIKSHKAYARTIVVNAWRSRLRRALLESKLGSRSPGEGGQSELHDEVMIQLDSLSVRQRAVLLLKYFDGYTDREAAAILGISVNSVKTHARRGLSRLRSEIGS